MWSKNALLSDGSTVLPIMRHDFYINEMFILIGTKHFLKMPEQKFILSDD